MWSGVDVLFFKLKVKNKLIKGSMAQKNRSDLLKAVPVVQFPID